MLKEQFNPHDSKKIEFNDQEEHGEKIVIDGKNLDKTQFESFLKEHASRELMLRSGIWKNKEVFWEDGEKEKWINIRKEIENQLPGLIPAIEEIENITNKQIGSDLGGVYMGINVLDLEDEEFIKRKKNVIGSMENGEIFYLKGVGRLNRPQYVISSLNDLKLAKKFLDSKRFDDLYLALDDFRDGDYGCSMLVRKGIVEVNIAYIRGVNELLESPKQVEEIIEISKEMELNKEFILRLEKIKKLLDAGYKFHNHASNYSFEDYEATEETPDEIYSSRGILTEYPCCNNDEENTEMDVVEIDGRIFLKKERE